MHHRTHRHSGDLGSHVEQEEPIDGGSILPLSTQTSKQLKTQSKNYRPQSARQTWWYVKVACVLLAVATLTWSLVRALRVRVVCIGCCGL